MKEGEKKRWRSGQKQKDKDDEGRGNDEEDDDDQNERNRSGACAVGEVKKGEEGFTAVAPATSLWRRFHARPVRRGRRHGSSAPSP